MQLHRGEGIRASADGFKHDGNRGVSCTSASDGCVLCKRQFARTACSQIVFRSWITLVARRSQSGASSADGDVLTDTRVAIHDPAADSPPHPSQFSQVMKRRQGCTWHSTSLPLSGEWPIDRPVVVSSRSDHLWASHQYRRQQFRLEVAGCFRCDAFARREFQEVDMTGD